MDLICDRSYKYQRTEKTKSFFTNLGTPKENLTKHDPWRGICTKMERNPYQTQCCISSSCILWGSFTVLNDFWKKQYFHLKV